MVKKAILLFSGIVFAGGVFAETVSIEQVRTLALANSRSLAKYSLSIRNSVLNERSHLYTMLPSPSAGYTATMNYMNYLNKEWEFEKPIDTFNLDVRFSVTQKIFEGGKSFIQKEINAISTEIDRKNALAEYFNVLDSADNAYYAVLEAAASLEAAESSLQTADISLSIAEIRRASGMLNQGDYLKALADKESRENSRNQARRTLALNITKLKAITGPGNISELEQIDFEGYEQLILRLGNISDEEADALFDTFWKTLVQSNPSLTRAALNSQSAEKNLSLAKRNPIPTISATVFSGHSQYSKASRTTNNTATGGISISGSIPIDFWVLANRIKRSKISQEMAALDYISAEISLETELHTALINAFAQAGSILSSRRSLEYAEKHFEFIMERYRLSQSSMSELTDASSLLITSRNNLIRAQYGFLQSLSRLRFLGAIDDEEKLARMLTGN